jgi:hypothetical protein
MVAIIAALGRRPGAQKHRDDAAQSGLPVLPVLPVLPLAAPG